jgi:hypothetical protein
MTTPTGIISGVIDMQDPNKPVFRSLTGGYFQVTSANQIMLSVSGLGEAATTALNAMSNYGLGNYSEVANAFSSVNGDGKVKVITMRADPSPVYTLGNVAPVPVTPDARTLQCGKFVRLLGATTMKYGRITKIEDDRFTLKYPNGRVISIPRKSGRYRVLSDEAGEHVEQEWAQASPWQLYDSGYTQLWSGAMGGIVGIALQNTDSSNLLFVGIDGSISAHLSPAAFMRATGYDIGNIAVEQAQWLRTNALYAPTTDVQTLGNVSGTVTAWNSSTETYTFTVQSGEIFNSLDPADLYSSYNNMGDIVIAELEGDFAPAVVTGMTTINGNLSLSSFTAQTFYARYNQVYRAGISPYFLKPNGISNSLNNLALDLSKGWALSADNRIATVTSGNMGWIDLPGIDGKILAYVLSNNHQTTCEVLLSNSMLRVTLQKSSINRLTQEEELTYGSIKTQLSQVSLPAIANSVTMLIAPNTGTTLGFDIDGRRIALILSGTFDVTTFQALTIDNFNKVNQLVRAFDFGAIMRYEVDQPLSEEQEKDMLSKNKSRKLFYTLLGSSLVLGGVFGLKPTLERNYGSDMSSINLIITAFFAGQQIVKCIKNK